MPKPLSEVKPEDIDAQFETIKELSSEEGSTILGAITGVTVGYIGIKGVNDFAGNQPVETQGKVKFGLKTILALIGVGELAGTLGMKRGGAKKAAVAGGASFLAVNVVDMASDAFTLKGVVFPKQPNNPYSGVQQWQPRQPQPPQPRPQEPPPEQAGPPELRGT